VGVHPTVRHGLRRMSKAVAAHLLVDLLIGDLLRKSPRRRDEFRIIRTLAAR
jgi:hypothetical protein